MHCELANTLVEITIGRSYDFASKIIPCPLVLSAGQGNYMKRELAIIEPLVKGRVCSFQYLSKRFVPRIFSGLFAK